LVLAAALGSLACAPPESCGPAIGNVARVIDGDTVVLAGGEHVRLLLVDTPEITWGHDDCYGAEASDFLHALLLGRTASLTYDKVCRDVYDRLLAYVTIDGRDVNAMLVQGGYACVLHIPPNGDARAAEFEALRDGAKANRRGMWGACPGVTCR
jgi:micrococcal nuclease